MVRTHASSPRSFENRSSSWAPFLSSMCLVTYVVIDEKEALTPKTSFRHEERIGEERLEGCAGSRRRG